MMIWFKVDEHLPPLGQFVLIYYSKEMTDLDENWEWTGDYSRYAVSNFKKVGESYEWMNDDGTDELIAPSHWAYLPEAPK